MLNYWNTKLTCSFAWNRAVQANIYTVVLWALVLTAPTFSPEKPYQKLETLLPAWKVNVSSRRKRWTLCPVLHLTRQPPDFRLWFWHRRLRRPGHRWLWQSYVHGSGQRTPVKPGRREPTDLFNEQDWKSNKVAALRPVYYYLLQHNAATLCKHVPPRLFPKERLPRAGAHKGSLFSTCVLS